MDLIDHGHHGAITACGSSKGLQPLSLGTDGIVNHHESLNSPVLPVGQDVEIMGQRLGPALLGVSDGQRRHIPAEGQIRVFQPLSRRLRIIGLVQDSQICAYRRKFFGIRLQNAHAHAASHHQKIKQIVVGCKAVDHRKGTVVVGHGILVGHRRASHPQSTAGKELTHVVNIVIQLFRLLSGRGRQRTVIFHRAAYRLPPELPAVKPGQKPGIGPGIDESAQLLHGIGRMFVWA